MSQKHVAALITNGTRTVDKRSAYDKFQTMSVICSVTDKKLLKELLEGLFSIYLHTSI